MRLQQPRRLGRPALGLRRVAGSGTPLRGRGSRQAPREMLSSWRATGEGAARSGAAALCVPRGTRVPGFSHTLGPDVRAGLGKPQSQAVSSEKVEDGALLSSLSPRVPPRGSQCGGAAPLG